MEKKSLKELKKLLEEFSFNILILGKDYVGLTAFFYKLRTGKFDPHLPWTSGLDVCKMKVKMENGKSVIFKVYDTKGQENLRHLTRPLFKDADGVLLIYSIVNKESFDDLDNWLNMLKEEIPIKIPIFLVGNKNDLEEEREITSEQGQKFAEEHGFMFSECSVKNDSWDKIKSIFEKLAKTIYAEYPKIKKEKEKYFEQQEKIKEEQERKEEEKRAEKRAEKNLKVLMKYLSF